MNTKPLVSVITIFLNGEKFLREAIESVLAQTYDNWELLLVDDGSTDSSTAIARQYAERYPAKIRYYEHDNHQNLGKSISRNLGFRNARGDYIALLDADDVYLPEKLQHQVAILESQPDTAMVYGPTLYWFSWAGESQDAHRDYLGKLGVKPNTLFEPPELLTLFLKDGGIVPCICALLIRSKIIKEVGGFEETVSFLFEDQVFLAKICSRSRVFVDNGCWDKYRQHPESSSSVAIKTGEYHPLRQNPARFKFLTWLEKYLSEQGIEDARLKRVLQGDIWPYRHPHLFMLLKGTQYALKMMKQFVKPKVKRLLAIPVQRKYQLLQNNKQRYSEGMIDFGSLRRLTPISRWFGYNRGNPIDRYYIEHFLAGNANYIRGRVLEIGDDSYTRKYGGINVTIRDVLNISDSIPGTTIVGDLSCADHIPSETFDCMILTQTLHIIYNFREALQTIYRILKPGGVVLATFPGISQISIDQWSKYWCWGFTTLSAQKMFIEVFPEENVSVHAFGNVFATTAFLYGLSVQELQSNELDYRDPDYELLITVRAIK
ncbi:MAG: glycosyltransferase [Candidatus Loosdrechtia sp.]|uniref:glycosyltransferase n=1 Tax=Candidatus Loosdrechtia sp. TaxID=3101272 RepID=UPI003A66B439|nr:MAG: glycosyltransferase [Candidatus Jettenia sp. AMX2]